MEYSFRNSVRDKKSTVSLDEFDIMVESGVEWVKVAYPQITEVRLSRKGNFYSIHISSIDHEIIEITNGSFDNQGKWIDQSRHYQTFVRALHLHLQNKCKASFYTGSSPWLHSMYLGVAAIIALVAFVMEEYFDVTPVSGLILCIGVFLCMAVVLIIPIISQRQREYSPANVPVKMLPPA